ncbi:MAG: hypothetical protein AB7I04_14695 [Pseudomonadales bacterium]
MSNPQKPTRNPDGGSDELLGDLESIRELLDEEALREGQADATGGNRDSESADTGVPLLDDMVGGAWEIRESSDLLSATPVLGGGGGKRSRYLREDVFNALLGDRWKTSASDILTEARGAIEAHRNRWTPEDTDELNEALRVRIDETLTEWLKAVVSERLDELHAELLHAAESVIDEKIRALIERRRSELDNSTD